MSKAQRRQRQDAQASAKALRGMSASACTLFLARHGETEWNAEHRCAERAASLLELGAKWLACGRSGWALFPSAGLHG